MKPNPGRIAVPFLLLIPVALGACLLSACGSAGSTPSGQDAGPQLDGASGDLVDTDGADSTGQESNFLADEMAKATCQEGWCRTTMEIPGVIGRHIKDLWVNEEGSDAVLTVNHAGYYRYQSGEWRKMPMPEDTNVSIDSEVWGIDEPEFAVSHGKLLKWNGSRWVDRTVPAGLEDSTFGRLRGHATDDLWLLSSESVYRYDGTRWTNLGAERTPLRERIDSQELGLTDLYVEREGAIYVVANGKLYELVQVEGGWDLKFLYRPGCRYFSAVHRAKDGYFYSAGPEGCVARLVQRQWNTFTLPSNEDVDPNRVLKLLDRPDATTPRIVSDRGTFTFTAEGTFELGVRGHFHDAMYLPEKKATILVPVGTDEAFVFRSAE